MITFNKGTRHLAENALLGKKNAPIDQSAT